MTGNEKEPRSEIAADIPVGHVDSNIMSDKKEEQPKEAVESATEANISDNGKEKYWQTRFEQLRTDYDHLQKINQNLEDKLLKMVEDFDKKREELVANIEYEKSTLMADVNKLSNKLVDARIKLHDYEEKELIHAAECGAPCHKNNSQHMATNNFSYNVGSNEHKSNTKNSNNNINKDSVKPISQPPTMTYAKANDDQLQMMNDPNLV